MTKSTSTESPGAAVVVSCPRLCYIANSIVPSTAANSVNVLCMSSALGMLGFDVTVISPVDSRRNAGTGQLGDTELPCTESVPALYGVWHPNIRGGGMILRAGLRAAFRRLRPGFVYGRMLAGCRLAARQGLPTVFEAHMPVWEQDAAKRRVFQDMIGSPAFAGIVTISNALREELLKCFPHLQECVVVAHDAAALRPDPGFPDAWPHRPMRILYTGSLYPGKGMETLLDIAPRCPWAVFQVVGGSEEEVNEWRSRIPSEVTNIELAGFRPHRELGLWMARADVLIAPYSEQVSAHGGRREIARWMSPLKLFEYMSANRPMVTSDLPVLREVLENNRNALLLPPGDIERWAAALVELRDDHARAANLARAARSDYEYAFTWQTRARRILYGVGWPTRDMSES